MKRKGYAKLLLPAVLVVILLLNFAVLPEEISSEYDITEITSDDKEQVIKEALDWLVDKQDTSGAWNVNYYPVGSTALVLLKLEEHAASLRQDPFEESYEYKTSVVKGWDYLSTKLNIQPLSLQNNNNPDTDGDNTGIYFSSGKLHDTYETGTVMLALQASAKPDRNFPNPPGCATTFRDVLEDCVDWCAWAQTDLDHSSTEPGRGGWGYTAIDSSRGRGDNSVNQWIVLGLMAAETWGIYAPGFVKSELKDYWLTDSRKNGCFGYQGPPPNVAKGDIASAGFFAVTASGLIQYTYCGIKTNDSEWKDASQCICDNWKTLPDYGNIGNLYAMYTLMKAAMTAQQDPDPYPEPVWDFCGYKWQEIYDTWIIDNRANDHWEGKYALPWSSPGHNEVLATVYTLLILQKAVPTPPPPPTGCFCGIYRNFPYEGGGEHDFGGDHCAEGQRDGLIELNLPWRPLPSPSAPPPIHRDDWYKIPSCCIRIDPAVTNPGGFGPSFIGLDFQMDDENLSASNFPPELYGGLDGDPFYFTAHWEATVEFKEGVLIPILYDFKLCSDDDAWFFIDGDLKIDLGGTHGQQCKSITILDSNLKGVRTIDIFYAERCNFDGILQFGISPKDNIKIIDSSHVCAKKSFEDLLKHHAERIQSFEDLLKSIPPEERTFEQLQSFENLLVEQEGLLEDFEELIMMELPSPWILPPPGWEGLHESEFIILLDSFEDLLHKQCELINSFEDLLYESEKNFDIEKFSELLSSQESLTESQEKLLESFDMLLGYVFDDLYDLDIDQKIYFLTSFEDLLKSQYELIKSFEDLLKIRLPEMSANQKNDFLESFERLLESQSGLIENFTNILDQSKEEFLTDGTVMPEFSELLFSLEDLVRNQDKLLKSFEDVLEIVLPEMSPNQRDDFLRSFEDLLVNQSELLKKFKDLLKWWLEHSPR